jgi:hypothetical protein
MPRTPKTKRANVEEPPLTEQRPTVSGRFTVEEDRMLLEAVAEIVGTHELGKDTLNVRLTCRRARRARIMTAAFPPAGSSVTKT